ncbi:MAG: TatD family hydrolase, partial [Chitinophagaceae bacterium]|nr:TatD family hydrolase [Chitinophagaceae bacterium]
MTSQLIDTHSHLYLETFSGDIQNVLERARAEGVARIFLPAIDSSETDRLLALEAANPGFCYAMMGLHPCSVKGDVEQELKLAEEWLGKRDFCAIGEIGLDYYWDKTFIDKQKDAFRRQIGWALRYDRPIVIHSRNATADCIEIVRECQNGKLRGIFHCFSDGIKEAEAIIEL